MEFFPTRFGKFIWRIYEENQFVYRKQPSTSCFISLQLKTKYFLKLGYARKLGLSFFKKLYKMLVISVYSVFKKTTPSGGLDGFRRFKTLRSTWWRRQVWSFVIIFQRHDATSVTVPLANNPSLHFCFQIVIQFCKLRSLFVIFAREIRSAKVYSSKTIVYSYKKKEKRKHPKAVCWTLRTPL